MADAEAGSESAAGSVAVAESAAGSVAQRARGPKLIVKAVPNQGTVPRLGW